MVGTDLDCKRRHVDELHQDGFEPMSCSFESDSGVIAYGASSMLAGNRFVSVQHASAW